MIAGKCRRRLAVIAIVGLLAFAGLRAHAENAAVEARMKKDITFLASDLCEGRGVTTKGINLAADYIANEFKQAGLKPAGEDGTYFQPFTVTGAAKLASPNTLILQGPLGQKIELKLGDSFAVLGNSGPGKVTARLVFAGYAATGKDISYDDFQGIDVAGKILVVIRKTPRAENELVPFDGNNTEIHATLTTKLDNAKKHNAAGVLFVSDRSLTKTEDRLMEFSYTSFGSAAGLPAIQIHRSLADQITQSALGRRLAEVEEDIDRDLKPQSAPLAGWTASLEVNVGRPVSHVKNIIGVLEGTGPLANETVIVGAHYDHLGFGGFGSLAKNLKGDVIHHGADDNGSGTTTIMELARRFGQKPNREGRRLVFMAFSGEEMGLLGSAHYCKHSIFPLEQTSTMVNLDMVGRLRPDQEKKKDKLIVYGTKTSPGFDKLIDELNAPFGFYLQKVPTGMGPSDQQSFYLKKIPVYFFFTGDHPDYHRPSDTSDKINLAGMARIADLVENLVEHLRTLPERPAYVKVKGGDTSPRMQGPRLGIRPTYGDDKEGVLLSGVVDDTPAAKAGLKEGDRILEIDGKPVKSLENYMVLMAGHKKGDSLDLGIVRDGKKQTVKVKLE
jgi:hypothetical protein